MRFSALFKNERTKTKVSHPVKDVKFNQKQLTTLINKTKAGMKRPTQTKTNPILGIKDRMKSCFAQMREAGVPKCERRTSLAYTVALLHAKHVTVLIELENDEDEQLRRMYDVSDESDDETEVAMAVSDGFIPANNHLTTIVTTSKSGRDVNISWTRPADPASLPSDSLVSGDSKALSGSNATPGENEDQPITYYTDGVRTHTIQVRNGIRFHHVVGPPLPAEETNFEQPERPFNHLPQEPRQRPRGLRRENAFCHKSHYEIFWHPGFGDFDKPPTTMEEVLPTHYSRPRNKSASNSAKPSSSPADPNASSNDETATTAVSTTVSANETVSKSAKPSNSPVDPNISFNNETATTGIPSTISASTPCASPTTSSVVRKRARDIDNSGDDVDGSPPRRRARS